MPLRTDHFVDRTFQGSVGKQSSKEKTNYALSVPLLALLLNHWVKNKILDHQSWIRRQHFWQIIFSALNLRISLKKFLQNIICPRTAKSLVSQGKFFVSKFLVSVTIIPSRTKTILPTSLEFRSQVMKIDTLLFLFLAKELCWGRQSKDCFDMLS